MRNLTVKREKSFVGCLGNLKLYIETADGGEITVNGTQFVKIGDLKNGQEKTFSVEDGARKVLAIFDKLSKDYCNDIYQLPEGDGDVFISGKNKFDPARGNAFVFNGNDGADAVKNRKNGLKIGLIVLVCCIAVGAVVGFFIGKGVVTGSLSSDEVFTDSGMSITLTKEFSKQSLDGYTVAYASEKVAVFALKEEFSLLENFENYSLDEYAELVKEANGISAEVYHEDGLTYICKTYKDPESGATFDYFISLYKSDDAFWMVQFAVDETIKDKFDENIRKWAKSVSFDTQKVTDSEII